MKIFLRKKKNLKKENSYRLTLINEDHSTVWNFLNEIFHLVKLVSATNEILNEINKSKPFMLRTNYEVKINGEVYSWLNT